MNKRVIILRKHLNLTQKQFAKELCFTSSNLSFIENGKSPLTESNIRLICFTFDVNEIWLRTGIGKMFNDQALLQKQEKILLPYFKKLSPLAKKLLIEYAEKLLSDEISIFGNSLNKTSKKSPGLIKKKI